MTSEASITYNTDAGPPKSMYNGLFSLMYYAKDGIYV